MSFISIIQPQEEVCALNQLVVSQSELNGASCGANQDSKFRRLNLKAEEKKVNLFYLKDILLKENCTPHERIDALFKIKKNI